MEINSKEE